MWALRSKENHARKFNEGGKVSWAAIVRYKHGCDFKETEKIVKRIHSVAHIYASLTVRYPTGNRAVQVSASSESYYADEHMFVLREKAVGELPIRLNWPASKC